ncbi:sulfatase-like hydrolase/transferase [Candidatus Sumerlaeota bacterium]|nr:sulfatase-like hydrolase/transferase [Candidatus Sumerlaeota bacterium]MBI3735694.1 sulfatase-like hydrolase/transferase [Candidatus Sumerlaeota bacterium]
MIRLGIRRRLLSPRLYAPLCRVTLFGLLCVSACTKEQTEPRKAAGNPAKHWNVVLITLDTTRPDHLGCYGAANARTPNIDALAARGVLFRNAFCQVPMTLPSHTSILTGLYPHHHGVRLNGPYRLADNIPTLAEILKTNGYTTAAFVSAFVLDSQFGLDRGFDVYDDAITRRAEGDAERRGGETEALAERWLAHVHGGPPFFLWLHLFDPHMPYDPPPPYAEQFKDDPYDGEIAYADECVGKIVAALKQDGVEDSTMIVFTADHGEGLGEHGELTHSLFIYDTTLRVPLIIVPPSGMSAGVWKKGSRAEGLAQSVDIAPTILDTLTLAARPEFDGANLFAESASSPEAKTLYAETLYPASFRWSPLYSLRDPQWKWIRAPKRELYDHLADPKETTNRAETEATIASALDAQLKKLRAGAGHAGSPSNASSGDLAAIRKLGYVASSSGITETDGAEDWPDPKDKVEVFDAINEARGAAEAGHADEAAKRLEPFAGAEKENPIFLQVFGDVLLRVGETARGLDMMERCYAANPDDPDLALRLANALLKGGKPGRAREIAERITQSQPEFAAGWDQLGVARGMLGDAAGAVAAGEQSCRIEPANADFRTHLGVSYLALDRAKDAETEFRATLKIQPDSRDAQFNLGLALNAQQRYSESAPILAAILNSEPQRADAAERLIVAQYQLGKKSEARELAENMIARNAATPLALFYLGKIQSEAGQDAAALANLETAALGLHKFPPAYIAWGEALLKTHDGGKAAALLGAAEKNQIALPPELREKLRALK